VPAAAIAARKKHRAGQAECDGRQSKQGCREELHRIKLLL
jgi:hypothetical protein